MQVQVADNIIQVKNLSKSFSYYLKEKGLRGSIRNVFHKTKLEKQAVKSISFDIARGSITGFVGMNGAGKTTTLKMLSGLLKETTGEIEVLGYYPFDRNPDFLKQISLVLGNKSQLWWDLPAIDSFYLNKEIYSVPDNVFEEHLNEMVDLFGVEELLKIQVRRLSLGERMKMELIAALIHKPKVIFLDEPTIGLDIITQYNIRNFLKEYVNRHGATLFLTSHNFDDITTLCDSLILMDSGEIIYADSFTEFKKRFFITKDILVQVKNLMGSALMSNIISVFGSQILKYEENAKTLRITCAQENSINILAFLIENHLNEIQELSIEDPCMDDVVRAIYQGNK